jgi:hypothetical protein
MHAEAALQRAESKAVDCAFAIFGLPRVDRPVTAQMTLPLRHGGLSLSCTSPAEGSAAYLSAAASTHKAMLNGPEAFQPFNGPSGVQLRTQWASPPGQAEPTALELLPQHSTSSCGRWHRPALTPCGIL